MAFYSDEVIQELKQQTNIADIIQQFVPLKRSGAGRFVCRCPFHNDHSPSMNVNPQMGIYKCFACGAGGDVFKFVMEHEKMDFKAAVEWVASATGFQLPELGAPVAPEIAEERTLVRELNELAADWFVEQLPKSEKALNYIRTRHLSEETRHFFKVGYAPEGREGFLSYAAKNGFSPRQLVEAGLAVERENGGIADKFRDRLMFAIENLSGKVVAFGGRVLEKQKKPKYLNSPETALYKKGEILYGLSKAKNEIPKAGSVVLVEGYFDMISLYQAGVKNVVAVSGTALTEKHAEILSRYTKSAYLVFDGDEAGRKAALRTIEIVLPEGIVPKIVALSRPNGEKIDPDNFVNEHGASAAEDFNRELTKAEDWFDYLNRVTPTETIEDRAKFVTHLKSILIHMRDRELQHQYLRLLAERYGTEANFVGIRPKEEKRKFHSEPEMDMPEPISEDEQVPWSALPPMELRFVNLIIASPSLWEPASVFFDLDFASSGVSLFASEILDELLSSALAEYTEHRQINLMRLHDSLSPIPAQVLESFGEETWDSEAAQKEFLESLAELEIRTAERFRDALKSKPITSETMSLRLELHQFASKTIRARLRSDAEVTRDPTFFKNLLDYRTKLVEYSEKI
ncbi:MAG: DNA primase [Hallerella succinigenes]|uniref:DNA primase n=1 Tax=Hallerella succinigenes TaxID=1896222 RepID=UPI0023F3DAD7|nr:DNA primase [Hallerella succinigenes]MDD6091568.1 DNA primase [Hallerella succinigenes]